MAERKKQIEILQQGGRFSVRQLRDGLPPVIIIGDSTAEPVDYKTWINPAMGLHEHLANYGFSASQVRQVFENLIRGGDAHLLLEISE